MSFINNVAIIVTTLAAFIEIGKLVYKHRAVIRNAVLSPAGWLQLKMNTLRVSTLLPAKAIGAYMRLTPVIILFVFSALGALAAMMGTHSGLSIERCLSAFTTLFASGLMCATVMHYGYRKCKLKPDSQKAQVSCVQPHALKILR